MKRKISAECLEHSQSMFGIFLISTFGKQFFAISRTCSRLKPKCTSPISFEFFKFVLTKIKNHGFSVLFQDCFDAFEDFFWLSAVVKHPEPEPTSIIFEPVRSDGDESRHPVMVSTIRLTPFSPK